MKNLLLPYRFKFVGLILLFLGFAFSIAYIWFDFQVRMPVFAVYSAFIETKTFATFPTNVADELILILLLSGFLLIVFSREKQENLIPEFLRLKAFMYSLIVNTALLLFSVIFVYGSGFIAVLVFNIISIPVFYLTAFYILKKKQKRQKISWERYVFFRYTAIEL